MSDIKFLNNDKNKWLLEENEVSKQYLIFDDGEGNVHWVEETDISAILNYNQILRNAGDKGYSESGEIQRIAKIPNAVIQMWKAEFGVDVCLPENAQLLTRLVNDSDYVKLRTSEGRA